MITEIDFIEKMEELIQCDYENISTQSNISSLHGLSSLT